MGAALGRGSEEKPLPLQLAARMHGAVRERLLIDENTTDSADQLATANNAPIQNDHRSREGAGSEAQYWIHGIWNCTVLETDQQGTSWIQTATEMIQILGGQCGFGALAGRRKGKRRSRGKTSRS